MNRYLVIGHRTLGGAHLFDHLKQLRGEDPSCRFHVVVPQYTPREMRWEEGTTHDIAQARRLADEVMFLHHGRLLEHAPAPEFFSGPQHPDAAGFIEGKLLR